jgi:hypothetical protein
VIAAGIGVGAVEATVMSATAFSGSAQFASLTVVGEHGGLLAILAALSRSTPATSSSARRSHPRSPAIR